MMTYDAKYLAPIPLFTCTRVKQRRRRPAERPDPRCPWTAPYPLLSAPPFVTAAILSALE